MKLLSVVTVTVTESEASGTLPANSHGGDLQ